MGYKALAPVDRFMERHRIPVIVGTGLVVAAGLPLLYWLQFDFNPLNLRSPKVESVATFLDLRSDPSARRKLDLRAGAEQGGGATPTAEKLSKLPEVASVKTIESFIPDDQEPKLAAIRQLGDRARLRCCRPDPAKKPPTDADNVARAQGGGRRPAAGRRHADRDAGRDRGQAACRQPRQGRRRRRSVARARPGGDDPAAQHRARRTARLSAGAAGDARNAAARDRQRMGHHRTAAPRSKSCRRAIPTTTRRCANSRARCRRSSRRRSAGRSRSSNPAAP